jgi:hypothetical protein
MTRTMTNGPQPPSAGFALPILLPTGVAMSVAMEIGAMEAAMTGEATAEGESSGAWVMSCLVMSSCVGLLCTGVVRELWRKGLWWRL